MSSGAVVPRDVRPPTLSVFKIVANALSRNEGRAELALNAADALGGVVRLPVPGKNAFLITSPDDLRRVMIQNAANYRKSFDYQILARLLGDGLLTSEGEIWRRDRRLQHPLFHGQALEKFYSTIAQCARDTVSAWKPGTEIALEAEMTRFGLHVIGERILSLDIRGWSEEVSHHLDVCQKQIVARGLALVDFARWIPTPGEIRFKRSLRELYRIVDEMIERRAKLGSEPIDLYSVLVAESYPKERLRDQFLTLFLAGHETTAIALTWAFYCLARHPEIDAQLAKEVGGAVSGFVPEREELEKLPYTRQVIDESLRLFPPVAFMGRETIEEDRLGGFHIPKDSIIVLCPYATHRRRDLWPDSEIFDPGRFEAAKRESIAVGAHVPFAMGPRGCIGQHFAMMELQIMLAAVAKRFRLELADPSPVRPLPLVSLRPSRSVRMRVIERGPV